FFRIRARTRERGTRRRLADSTPRITIHLQRARKLFSRAWRQDRDRPANREPGSTSEIARHFFRYDGLAICPHRRRSIANSLSSPIGEFPARAWNFQNRLRSVVTDSLESGRVPSR